MIGFLSPEGEFIECKSWEHRDKAKEICFIKYDKDFYIRQDAEDYLLSIGYLVLRANDAYMSYKNDTHWIVLTELQLAWLDKNAEKMNKGQTKDLNEILYDQEDIRKTRISNVKR